MTCLNILSCELIYVSSKSMFLRQESTLTLFTQTKQYCNFVKTGLMTSQLTHCFFPAIAEATNSNETSLER